jgi:hypothetical protein
MSNDEIPCRDCLTLPICKSRYLSECIMTCSLVRSFVFTPYLKPKEGFKKGSLVFNYFDEDRVLKLKEFLR